MSTVTPSLTQQLVSVLSVQAFWRWIRWQGELWSLPLCSSLSSRPSLVLSARHAAARLFDLKVLYLSSPPWQPATLVPGSAHIRLALSCLTCLVVKDDPWTCSRMSAHDEWGMDTDNCSGGMGGNGGSGGGVGRGGINLFEAMSTLMGRLPEYRIVIFGQKPLIKNTL